MSNETTLKGFKVVVPLFDRALRLVLQHPELSEPLAQKETETSCIDKTHRKRKAKSAPLCGCGFQCVDRARAERQYRQLLMRRMRPLSPAIIAVTLKDTVKVSGSKLGTRQEVSDIFFPQLCSFCNNRLTELVINGPERVRQNGAYYTCIRTACNSCRKHHSARSHIVPSTFKDMQELAFNLISP